ncbi:IclR family transcriptional regulator [Frankia sp. CNm7]|uniref:IclR family transcriptional regulator n=1 Tax=Frankia nepalensis TaxID=1836974 RepID=UPI00193471D8|nr:IclR family transcriptional regulator [Frankia nepalensis]MBL7496360.1 IclR family transcriptional regulator [Frankia nepalensis]MBL7508443.1 IclR family transcriptional regulator [Frankia nepalensis]MBL7520261.1 IclR family transcriptional regulator [Frankia nepalensis]
MGSDRVLAVLKELARHPDGVGLDELTRAIGSPKPTVHRGLRALCRAGLADQDERGRYRLGDEFLRMAFAHHEARPEHVRVRPVLELLASRFGETTHYAVLDGREVVYRAKVDPPAGAVRLTSTIGGRNPAHATGVGKLLLAHHLRTREDVAAWVDDLPLARRTPRTRCTVDDLHRDLREIRERGYATDDQENENGINCIALPVYPTSPATPSGAVSISALAYRTPVSSLVDALGEIRRTLGPLGEPHPSR